MLKSMKMVKVLSQLTEEYPHGCNVGKYLMVESWRKLWLHFKSYEVRDPMNIWNKYDFAMSGLGKKSKILPQIKHFFKCVKWSKQRITRGYCDCDVWEMFSFLQTLIPDMLQTLKDKVYLLFVICYQFLFNVNNIRKHDFLTVIFM